MEVLWKSTGEMTGTELCPQQIYHTCQEIKSGPDKREFIFEDVKTAISWKNNGWFFAQLAVGRTGPSAPESFQKGLIFCFWLGWTFCLLGKPQFQFILHISSSAFAHLQLKEHVLMHTQTLLAISAPWGAVVWDGGGCWASSWWPLYIGTQGWCPTYPP